MRVLVIEDDKEAAAYLVKALGEVGHAAERASDGETGAFMVGEGGYDVVIVDRMLPKRDGLAIIETNIPAVQRASHSFAVNDALRQGAVFVRTFVMQGEDFVRRGTENGDVAASGTLHDARTELRNVFEFADEFEFAHLVCLSVSS